jgi:hypothetical protein
MDLEARPLKVQHIILALALLLAGILIYYRAPSRMAAVPKSAQTNVTLTSNLPKAPEALTQKKAKQGQAKIPDWLKPRTAPTQEEIERFLSLATEKHSAYAWAYAQSKDTRWLKEGLLEFPNDTKLNYLAALLQPEAAQADPDLAKLKSSCLVFLRNNLPGIAALLLANEQQNSTRLDTIHQFYDGRAQFYQIDAAFRYTDEEFLTAIRDYSPLASKRESMYPRSVGITPKLHELACSANPQLADVARLILAGSDLVKSALVGTELQNELVTTLSESDVQARLGSSKSEYLKSIQEDVAELNNLKQIHDSLYTPENAAALLRFQELRREVGERDALRSIQHAQTHGSRAE